MPNFRAAKLQKQVVKPQRELRGEREKVFLFFLSIPLIMNLHCSIAHANQTTSHAGHNVRAGSIILLC